MILPKLILPGRTLSDHAGSGAESATAVGVTISSRRPFDKSLPLGKSPLGKSPALGKARDVNRSETSA